MNSVLASGRRSTPVGEPSDLPTPILQDVLSFAFFHFMIHPHTEVRYISKDKGYGLVATQFIPKGTITWVMDALDQVFAPAEVSAMPDAYREIIDTYTFRDHKGNFILCWDNARFVNHSFRSNCMTTAYDFEIAIRDIEPGEELTDDYGYLNITEPFQALPERGVRRRVVRPDDLLHFHKTWDKKLLAAFRHYNAVEQPLEPLLRNDVKQKARGIAAGQEKMDSILNCLYREALSA
jgi:hypothetical protein